MKNRSFEAGIIGSGPAGLFAALELVQNGIRSVAVFDKLPYPSGGLINDGKLNFDYRIGIEEEEIKFPRRELENLIEKVKKIFTAFPACRRVTDTRKKQSINNWEKIAEEHGVEFIAPEQWHYGTDNSKKMVNYLRSLLEDVEFFLGHEITEVEKNENGFTLHSIHEKENLDFQCKHLIVAPGRQGAYWWKSQAKKLNIPTKFGRIDVGIRVELNRKFYDPITDIVYDPKFKLITKRHSDRVRTFCTNPGGRVRTENYGPFKLVNGDALSGHKTPNTNFALINSVGLTKPFSDSTEFGRFIAHIFSLLGGNKPIMQRVGDFREGRRSKKHTFNSKSYHFDECVPTLNAMPGDISLGFPARIMDNLWEALKTLDKIVPGVLHPSTILYAPEIKFFDTKYDTDRYLESTVPGIFLAGDGAGKSRGIVGAAISGIIAARGILKK